MNVNISKVNLERRATKTLIQWYSKINRFGWVKAFGPEPADHPNASNEIYMAPLRAIQMELGRRVLKEAKWGERMNEETKPLTIESIREDLRGSIMEIALFSTACSMEGKERENEVGKMSADNLARFGVNCGLISTDEYKDWYGAIHNNSPFLADVALKYKGGEV